MAEADFKLGCVYMELNDTENARWAYQKGRELDENLALRALRCNPDVY